VRAVCCWGVLQLGNWASLGTDMLVVLRFEFDLLSAEHQHITLAGSRTTALCKVSCCVWYLITDRCACSARLAVHCLGQLTGSGSKQPAGLFGTQLQLKSPLHCTLRQAAFSND
jgi:hypothetical protein